MARPLAKSPFVLLALGLWILACRASLAEVDDPKALNQQVAHLIEQGKYQEAIPIAERAVEVAKRVRSPEDPETADALNNLGFLFNQIGDYAKAEPLYQQVLQIRKKVLGPENPETAITLNDLALLYRKMGQYAKAEPLYQRALQIRTKVLGPEHAETAESLNNLAVLYEQMGQYAKAEALYVQALQIFQKVLGPERAETAQLLNNLANLHVDMGNYAKAEPLFEQALQIRKKVLGPEHLKTAESLDSLADLYDHLGDYAKAAPLFEQALQIRKKVLGPEHPDTASSLNNLALLNVRIGDYAKAEPLLQQALQIFKKVLGPEHPETATALSNLAGLYEGMGDYAKAEPLCRQALQIRKKVLGPEHPDTAASLNSLAVLYDDMGDYADAEALYQQSLQINKKVLGPEHSHTVTSLNSLALLYDEMGDYAKAEPLLQQVLQIKKKVLGLEHPDTALSLSSVALLYEHMGDYAKAEPLCEQALQINRKVLGPEDPDTAKSLNNLAVLYYRMRDYARAEPLFQQVLQIKTKVLGPEHPDIATGLSNLAGLYEDMGDYAKAEPLCRQALQIRKKVLGPEHPDTATSLNNLAHLYEDMGDYVKAEPLFHQALEMWKKVLGPEHPYIASVLKSLALLNVDRGQIREAKSFAEVSAKAYLAVLSKMLSFASEQQRLAYEDTINPYILFPVLKGSEADLATALLRYKGVVLDSIIEDRLVAEASKENAGRDSIVRLAADKTQLGQLLLETPTKPSGETNKKIEVLEQEVEQIEAQLAQRVSGFGRARRALSVSVEQVQAVIPKNCALIEYLRYAGYLGKRQWEQRYGAIVLASTGQPRWIRLGEVKEVDKIISRYQSLVRDASDQEELSANLENLYEELWAPIEQSLPPDAKRAIISPDGQLNFVSFATLVDSEKRFLAEKYKVQYVASGRDLLRELKPSTAREVVLFANPDFDLSPTPMLAKADNGSGSIRGSEKRDVEDWSFESLAGTQRERDELIKKFAGWGWTPSDFTAEKATKEALLKIHSPYILHLATHGFFAQEDPTAIQTDASLNDRQSVTKSKFFKNPMHRSGLALAGAQTTIEAWKRDQVPPVENDGILTAEDVSTLDLQGTWLVTLSACDTGSGQARAGEGVMGLRRGFIQAGAQNLLVTLWPISDEFTVQMMSDFYAAAHETGNAPEALAEVQRNWLVKLRTEKGLAQAVNLAGPFIMSSQGKP